MQNHSRHGGTAYNGVFVILDKNTISRQNKFADTNLITPMHRSTVTTPLPFPPCPFQSPFTPPFNLHPGYDGSFVTRSEQLTVLHACVCSYREAP